MVTYLINKSLNHPNNLNVTKDILVGFILRKHANRGDDMEVLQNNKIRAVQGRHLLKHRCAENSSLIDSISMEH